MGRRPLRQNSSFSKTPKVSQHSSVNLWPVGEDESDLELTRLVKNKKGATGGGAHFNYLVQEEFKKELMKTYGPGYLDQDILDNLAKDFEIRKCSGKVNMDEDQVFEYKDGRTLCDLTIKGEELSRRSKIAMQAPLDMFRRSVAQLMDCKGRGLKHCVIVAGGSAQLDSVKRDISQICAENRIPETSVYWLHDFEVEFE